MSYGIPYMGSKQDIIASLALNFPRADNFYDLFGGGFSVTHYMIQNKSHWYKNFFYNEINASTVDLIKKAIAGDFSYSKFKPEWISREDFFARLDEAYVRICWSFGNNQKDYLFGKEIEQYKKSLHQAVIFDEFDDIAKSVLGFQAWPENIKDVKSRRCYIRQKVAFDNKKIKRGDLQRLEQLERLEQLQQLEQLERLQQLEQLERLQQLELTSLDYRQVEIKPNSVVYCDIPYSGTKKYTHEFNHNEFFDWAASREFPVYISEYNISDPRFEVVYSVSKSVKLSSKGRTKENADLSREKLYWNKK